MKYEMQGKVRFSEVDRGKYMTLPGIVNYFQDCSTFQSEELGIGFKHLESHHKAWILSSWQIVLARRPKFGEQITVSTWATDFQGIYGVRNFEMCDQDGGRSAYANWNTDLWLYGRY